MRRSALGRRAPRRCPRMCGRATEYRRDPTFCWRASSRSAGTRPLLIEAFAAAKAGGAIEERLVLIGADRWGIDSVGAAKRAGVGESVVWAAHAPMEDLAHLYRGATAFVLPTEHEGFSLTIPEAMACGTPAIVFDHAALEDDVREAAMLVEPRTKEALAEALRSVARDAPLRNRPERTGPRMREALSLGAHGPRHDGHPGAGSRAQQRTSRTSAALTVSHAGGILEIHAFARS